jgi:hypothetical protein
VDCVGTASSDELQNALLIPYILHVQGAQALRLEYPRMFSSEIQKILDT